MEKGKCKHCNKTLKKFIKTPDWGTRKYHKKCFLQMLILKKLDNQ